MKENNKSMPQAQRKKNARFNHVWWIPLVALLIVSYIAINRYLSQGPLITITFADAEGLAVEKTKVRYKDVSIGQVEKIHLSDDYKTVTISVRMDRVLVSRKFPVLTRCYQEIILPLNRTKIPIVNIVISLKAWNCRQLLPKTNRD